MGTFYQVLTTAEWTDNSSDFNFYKIVSKPNRVASSFNSHLSIYIKRFFFSFFSSLLMKLFRKCKWQKIGFHFSSHLMRWCCSPSFVDFIFCCFFVLACKSIKIIAMVWPLYQWPIANKNDNINFNENYTLSTNTAEIIGMRLIKIWLLIIYYFCHFR